MLGKVPIISFATAFNDVNADINIKHDIFLFAAKCVAGPLPILLPNTIISSGLIFTIVVR